MVKPVHSGVMLAACLLAPPLKAEEPPEALWLTGAGEIAIATGACDAAGNTLCGIVAGVPGAVTDRELALHRDSLCGLTIIWDLFWDPSRQMWVNGKVLDPSTEDIFNLSAKVSGDTLKLWAWAGNERMAIDLHWRMIRTLEEPCQFPE